MSLRNRALKVTLSLPSGDVVLDETIQMHVRIHKSALAIQNSAVIEATGLTQSLREQLLSQFTAWNKRLVESGQAQQNWINVTIEAGYKTPPSAALGVGFATPSNTQTSVIFKGQVVLCDLASVPPNITVRITCYTRQIDKTAHVTNPAPAQTTFFNYVKWAAGQMGFGDNFVCDTSFNDVIIYNPARSILVASALIWDIQDMYKPNVAAFIDDDILIVKDRNKIINPSNVSTADEFIGVPSWNEWGVDFVTMFDPTVRLAQATRITSKMNPSLNGPYVITELFYDLSSRGQAFYVKSSGSPPA